MFNLGNWYRTHHRTIPQTRCKEETWGMWSPCYASSACSGAFRSRCARRATMPGKGGSHGAEEEGARRVRHAAGGGEDGAGAAGAGSGRGVRDGRARDGPASRDARPGSRRVRPAHRPRPGPHARPPDPRRAHGAHPDRGDPRAGTLGARRGARARRHDHRLRAGARVVLPADPRGSRGGGPALGEPLLPFSRGDEPSPGLAARHLALRAHRGKPREPPGGRRRPG